MSTSEATSAEATKTLESKVKQAEVTNFAIVKTGGKQYRVTPGQRIEIEKLEGAVGDKVEFNEVLLVNNNGDTVIGAPLVNNCKVLGTILKQDRDPKVIIFKKRRRKGYTKKQGHRQDITAVLIDAIA